jgi:endogenous inhibitor of DNA gyrase (YacG/DUF329 family)
VTLTCFRKQLSVADFPISRRIDMPTLPCPTCQKPVEWSAAAKWRPFCSERCRLIDLGAWMSERHAIPGEELQPGDESAPAPAQDSESPHPRH